MHACIKSKGDITFLISVVNSKILFPKKCKCRPHPNNYLVHLIWYWDRQNFCQFTDPVTGTELVRVFFILARLLYRLLVPIDLPEVDLDHLSVICLILLTFVPSNIVSCKYMCQRWSVSICMYANTTKLEVNDETVVLLLHFTLGETGCS
jgi:hypothetical protein